jgi:hypothetical protein
MHSNVRLILGITALLMVFAAGAMAEHEPQRAQGLSVHSLPKHVVEARDPSGHTRPGYLISIPGETRAPLERPVVGSAAELVALFKKQTPEVRENGIWLLVATEDTYTRGELKDIERLKQLCKAEAIPLFICHSVDYPDGWKRFS